MKLKTASESNDCQIEENFDEEKTFISKLEKSIILEEDKPQIEGDGSIWAIWS